MLIISDFDGTVTARDTNSALAREFAPAASERVAGKLRTRELTLQAVLEAEFEGITSGIDAVVASARTIPFRAGWERLLDSAEAAGAQVVLLSSGFREVIEPMLEQHGVAGRVPLIANSIELDASGGRIAWRDLPTCELCGEPCKRHDVARLRAEHAADGELVVFVGDGMSDRCGAESADRVFARDGLATYLDERGIAYDAWDDFDDVAALLGLVAPGVRT